MSAIDKEIASFYAEVASLKIEIDDCKKWIADYENKRANYPAWVTKDGQHIWVYEIDEDHLDNLIPFVQRKDPENKTRWVDVFKAEQKYRRLKNELPYMRAELLNMESVVNKCL